MVYQFLFHLDLLPDFAKEKENIVHYYNTNYRSPKHEIGILWNDPLAKIKWPIKEQFFQKKTR